MSKEAFELAADLLALWPGCLLTLEKLGDAQSQGRRYVAAAELDETVALLRSYGYVRTEGNDLEITARGKPVLNKGKWLEAMACVLLRKSGYFDEIRANVCLQSIENELYLVVARNGKAAVLECKAGSLGGQGTLNKLQSIRSTLETFVRGFFVTSHTVDRIPWYFRDRADGYGIRRVVTVEDLLHLSDIVREGMRGGP